MLLKLHSAFDRAMDVMDQESAFGNNCDYLLFCVLRVLNSFIFLSYKRIFRDKFLVSNCVDELVETNRVRMLRATTAKMAACMRESSSVHAHTTYHHSRAHGRSRRDNRRANGRDRNELSPSTFEFWTGSTQLTSSACIPTVPKASIGESLSSRDGRRSVKLN